MLGFAVVLGRSWYESILFGFALVAGTIYLRSLWAWLRGRRQAGGVLLDCGPHPARRSLLINAALFFVMGVLLNLSSLFFRDNMDILGLFVMFHAIVMALLAFPHFELREHGLWAGTALLPWDRIESYWWDGDRTLMLTTKGRWFLLKKSAVFVRPELREAVDRLFSTMAPAGVSPR